MASLSANVSVPSVGSYDEGQLGRGNNSNTMRRRSAEGTEEGENSGGLQYISTESELTLLCLDYLRDLRRAYPKDLLKKVEGLDPDYLTMACWALNRAFVLPPHLRHDGQEGNDAFVDAAAGTTAASNASTPRTSRNGQHPKFPSLKEMEGELLCGEEDDDEGGDQKKQPEDEDLLQYEYNDAHPSNSHRFYALGGLAGVPITLGEVTAAGLSGLGARSRGKAEKEMIQSELFTQFVSAVKEKGFFDDHAASDPSHGYPSSPGSRKSREQMYEDRFRKVVAKFRTKLASKAFGETSGDLMALSAAEQQRHRRAVVIQHALEKNHRHPSDRLGSRTATPSQFSQKLFFQDSVDASVDLGGKSNHHNPVDVQLAEKLKNEGNTHMQRKEFEEAADCYTRALKICPTGPHAHVYFSNRAAALVSMKQFELAILDSERSLALKPDYGKAHARLGLAHFLLGNYRPAMEAYTVALKYEPDNKSSKNYFEKAAKRLAEQSINVEEENASSNKNGSRHQTSFSVVSEWEKSKQQQQKQHHSDSYTSGNKNQDDFREAEKFKVRGNSHMANRKYELAMQAYARAIELCPNGPQSHVYYSNRAAALCYVERYAEAQADSLQSLALNPNYGKAHARLGLSRFFLKDYAGAVQAYTAALQYDPDNAASKSYLEKAKAKLQSSLVQSTDVRNLADKVLASMGNGSNGELLDDPEMQLLAQKALNDPSVMAAMDARR